VLFLDTVHCCFAILSAPIFLTPQLCEPVPEHVKGKMYWGNRECTLIFDGMTSLPFDDLDAIDQ
jgi:hypothetical protein